MPIFSRRAAGWISIACVALFVVAMAPDLAAQSPWERAAGNLMIAFTGGIARSLTIVAIVVTGLMWMFGEHGIMQRVSGLVLGGSLALFAAQFLAWLY